MADEIPVHLILSPDLPHHRVCLDAFERIKCRRAQIEVQTLEGLLEAWIYLDAERLPSNGHPAGVALTRHHLVRSACEMLGYRSEEHTSELQSLMRISSAVFCLKQNN